MSPSATTDSRRRLIPKAIAAWCLVVALYVAVAASTFGGFFSKWAFRDDSSTHSLMAILEGTGARPFVYRQLLPAATDLIARTLPASLAESITATSLAYPHIADTYARATGAREPERALRYRIAYYLVFLAWLAGLGLLGVACFQATGQIAAATLAPLVFAQAFPFLQTRGGYFYDPVEVAFLAASIALACSRHRLWIVLLAPIATLNKEAFLFWLPCLLPFYWKAGPRLRQLPMLAAAMVVSAGVYWTVRTKFAGNAGAPMENHLIENLQFYTSLRSYLGVEYTYGLPFPRGVSIFNVFGLALLIGLAWQRLPVVWRQHLLLATVINIPLLLAFCWFDELRNLSFLFVGFTVMIATAIAAALDATASTARPIQPGR